jgi:ketosteroid isomerase-like protein
MATPVQWNSAEIVGIPLPVGVTVADRVNVAREVLEGFAARDHDLLPTLFAPEVELQTRVDVIGEWQFTGHDGVRAWLSAVDEKYDRFDVVDAEYEVGAGDAVVVACRLRLQHAGDRYGMSRLAYWVFRIDQDRGLVLSFTSYRDLAEARAAAGLATRGA